MMRALAPMLLAALLAACADQPPRDPDLDKRLAEQEEQERREQERLCRIYAETGRRDPRCPMYPQPEREGDPITPPPLPPLPPTR